MIAVVWAIAAAFVAAPAYAAGAPAVADCNAHGTLTRHYSPGALRSALDTMPADVKEYTNCYDVIQRALVADLGQLPGNGGGGSDSSSSFLPTPVIVVLALLVVAAAAFGLVAMRRRRSAGGSDHP